MIQPAGAKLLKWDGHTHTRYCKHGCDAEQEFYLNRAIELGFQRYTISEHPPLPDRWVQDEGLMAELAMSMEELPEYIGFAKRMKEQYMGSLEVTVGLEMDYLYGAEDFSNRILEPYLDVLEDVVVSVHYLPGVNGMRCIDYKPEDFAEGLLAYYGSMEKVVETYYDHIELAIEWGSTLPVSIRKRIGHINLIEKFRLAQSEPPSVEHMDERLRRLLPKLEAAGMGIDVNTAGLRKGTCGKVYVPEWFMLECIQRGIPCVYGSDTHSPDQVGYGWEWYEKIAAAAQTKG